MTPPDAPALRVLGRFDAPPRDDAHPGDAPRALPALPRVLVALAAPVARHGARHVFADLHAGTLPARGSAVLDAVRAAPPAVLFLDQDTRHPDAFEVLTRLGAEAPRVAVVLVTDGDRPTLVLRALAAGAAGALDRRASPHAFRHAARRAAQGNRVLPDSVRDALARAYATRTAADALPLTRREFQVARGVGQGRTTAQLADDLGVAPSTVRSHKAAIRDKLGLAGDAAIARYAALHDIV